MDHQRERTRLAETRVGRLATVFPDGRPHIVPCCFALAGDRLITAVDAKPKSTLALQRLANLRANPAATLLVDHYLEDWSQLWWVRVDGIGQILDRNEDCAAALLALCDKYPQYRVSPPPGPFVAIDIHSWHSWP